MSERPSVCIVDDDESVRESLVVLLETVGYTAQAFPSAAAFLASDALELTRCAIVDIAMPGMSGPELQRELALQGRCIALVFITAHGDESSRRRMRATGAVDCLLKPFSDDALLDAVRTALEVHG